MANMKDYYEILGIGKEANADDVRKAYRDLAKKYHPDRNPGNADAEKRFKEINESYEVLGNPPKRKQYDQMRDMGGRGFAGFNPFEGFGGLDFSDFVGKSNSAGPGASQSGTVNFEDLGDLGDLFSSVFSGTGPFTSSSKSTAGATPQTEKGEDVYIKLDVPFEVAAKGGKSNIRLQKTCTCEDCKGTGAKPGTQSQCRQCGGTGKIQSRQGAFAVSRPCPGCLGRGYVVQTPCGRCQGNGTYKRPRTLSVNIPAGIQSGQKIKLSGEGKPGSGGPSGDLYIEVCIQEHSDFQREGNNLISEHIINLRDALLGTKILVKTLTGEVELTVPPGVQPGSILRIPGHGIQAGAHQGDHLARLQVRLPSKLNSRQKELVEELARLGME